MGTSYENKVRKVTYFPTQKVITVMGNDKDFPEKDYGKKKGWGWMVTVCPKGHIVYLQKSYCKDCKGKFWSILDCDCDTLNAYAEVVSRLKKKKVSMTELRRLAKEYRHP
jgi:hypothetical protein